MNDSPNGGPPAAESPPVAPREVTLAQAAGSAVAALFGVQSRQNRERDFESRSPGRLIFMGAVMTCVFITCVLFAVRCSMQQAGVAP